MQKIIIPFVVSFFFILPSISEAGVSKSSLKDQTSVEVTVYNNNLGLVKDTRKVTLEKGQGELEFMDVAASIMPVTVTAKSVDQVDKFGILEQNYEYDLMSETKLLDKYVGKKIKIIDTNYYQDRKETVEAELLSNNQGQIYRIGKEIYLGHAGTKVLPELPENLISQPTLKWLYLNNGANSQTLEVSYLTENMNWKADYVLVLGKEDKTSDLTGWVTIDNRSGAIFRDAKLKLIAGEVKRAEERAVPRPFMMKAVMAEGRGGAQFEEKSLFEYHSYDLKRRTTIKDNQTKQIRFLEANGIKTEKEFIVKGETRYWFSSFGDEKMKQPVNVVIKFVNSEENHLAIPIPAGVMRLYKMDDEGSLQFVGEDNVEHTPKNEKIELSVGEAFDLTCERKQMDFKQISTRAYETEWEVTLRNHKKETVKIAIVEPMQGSWEVIKKSHNFKKDDAFHIRFEIEVPSEKEVKLTYRVRVGI